MAVTFTEFQEWLDKNVPNNPGMRKCLFFGAAELSKSVREGSPATQDNLSQVGIATLLLATKVMIEREFPLLSQDQETFESCYAAAKHYTEVAAEGVETDEYRPNPVPKPTREAVLLSWVWILCSNHLYQGDTGHRIANVLVLTGLSGFRGLRAQDEKTNLLFKSGLNVDSARDYFYCLFGLWTLATTSIVVRRDKLLQNSPNKEELLPVLDHIIGQLSFSSNEPIHSPRFLSFASYSGKPLAEALFLRFPIIRIADGQYLFAGHAFLKNQMTSKFLTKCQALARDLEGRGDTQYSQFLGERLEKFFRELCIYWNPKIGHYDEFDYQIGRERKKSPDRIVVERRKNSEVVSLFQMKVKLLQEATITGASWRALEADLASSFSKSISQSVKFLYDLHHGLRIELLSPEYQALCKRLKTAKAVCLIGITPDLPSLFCFKPLRDLLIKQVQGNVGAIVWEWFTEKYDKNWYWHVLDLEEFETFLILPKRKRNFFDLLTSYLKRSRIDDNQVYYGKFPGDFRNFIIWNFGGKKPDTDTREFKYELGLLDVFGEATEGVKKYFFGQV